MVITDKEAAKYLRLSSKTLDKFRLSDRGPRYYKLGRRVMYTQKDLDSWAQDRQYISTHDEKLSKIL